MGSISIDCFPNLRTLCVAETALKIQGHSANLQLLSSNEDDGGRAIRLNQRVAFAQLRGTREICEDVALVRADAGLYGLFEGSKTSETLVVELTKSCRGKLDEDVLLNVIENRLKTVKVSKIRALSSCAVVLRTGRNEIVYIQNGNVRILLIGADGLLTVMETEIPRKPVHPHLTDRQNVGTWIVYGIDYKPLAKRQRIPAGTKWMIVVSHGIREGLTDQLISAIAEKAESAVAFAYDLRAAAYARMVPENLSAIVVDFG
jgi:hypothetical protein